MTQNTHAIGVFDSGIGGLSVVKQLSARLPHENIIYFGDIARIPYGTKSVATIRQFTQQTVQFLLKQRVKALVIACNTISAVALDTVTRLAANIPVVDVISSGVEAVINSGYTQVGIIATQATIKSAAYVQQINQYNTNISVLSTPCPLFVPMIEEGLNPEHPALIAMAQDYLQPLTTKNLQALVLGCTHYPLIQATISHVLGNNVSIIDPAIQTSLNLAKLLAKHGLLNPQPTIAQHKFYITDDDLSKFKQLAEMFLHTPISAVELAKVGGE